MIKTGYKQTEVGVIPEDWEVVQLGAIGQFKNGINKGSEAFGHGYPFVNLLDVFGKNSLSLRSEFGLVDSSDVERGTYDLKQSDVIFIRSSVKPSGVGLTAVVMEDLPQMVYSGFLIRYRDKGYIDTDFKKFCFYEESFRKSIIAASSVSANTNINQDNLKRVNIALPFIKSEQTAIAKALSDTDALIQSLSQLIAKKRQIKQGAMQTLLNPYDETGALKAGWEIKVLKDVANIYRGASPRPIENPIWFDDQSKVGWVRISDVTKSKKYLQKTVQKLSESGIKHSRFVQKESLIMSICATVGRPILTKIDVCIHDGFVIFDNCTVDKQYLYYFLSFIEADWAKNGQTGSQMNLNTGLINSTTIPIVKKAEEQARIAQILTDMDTEITALETKLSKYQKIKQGMMQNLLTGRIRLVTSSLQAGKDKTS